MASTNRITPFSATRRKTLDSIAQDSEELLVIASAVRDAVLEEMVERFNRLEVQLKRLDTLQADTSRIEGRIDNSDLTGASFRKELELLPKRVDDAARERLPSFEEKALSIIDKELPNRIAAIARFKVDELVASKFKSLEGLEKSYSEIEPYFKDLEGHAAGLVARVVDRDFSQRVGMLVKSYEDRLTGVRERRDKELHDKQANHETELKTLASHYEERFKALQDSCVTQLNEAKKSFDTGLAASQKEHATALSTMKAYCEDRLGDMQKAYGKMMEDMTALIQAMPQPQVFVPPDAIHITQSTPQCLVDSIKVSVEQAQPIINVAPANTEPSIINVNVPKPRRTRKQISYDYNGAPSIIEEIDIEE